MRHFDTILPPALLSKPEEYVYIPNNRTLLRYNQALYQRFAYCNNFGLALDDDDRNSSHGKPVLLSKLFVVPKLSSTHIRPDELIDAELNNDKQIAERLPFHSLLKKNRRLFLLGDPGTGKSTLINWLMLELSFSGDNLCKSTLGPLVPLAFILRDMDLTEITTWNDLWERWSKANPEFSKILAKDKDTIKQVFVSGQAILLFDGLDEISNKETRLALGKTIVEVMAKYPRCRFVITSRILGFSQKELLQTGHPIGRISSEDAIENVISSVSNQYSKFSKRSWEHIDLKKIHEYTQDKNREELLLVNKNKNESGSQENSIEEYYLSPFGLDQARSFAHNWYTQYVVKGKDRDGRARELFSRLGENDGLSRLARIPVLLNIICFIHARRGRLPDGRAELYTRIAETYLTSLDNARGLRFRDRDIQFDYHDLRSWLGQIAWKIQEGRAESGKSIFIGHNEVTKIFTECIKEVGFSERDAKKETEFLLAYIAERSGLFVPRGESDSGETLYAFTHLSFMEYFTAFELRDQVEFWGQEGTEWQDLRIKMQLPIWKEIMTLFFELMEKSIQVETYLARLVGSPESLVNYMPKLSEERSHNETVIYSWCLLAGIVTDTAVKLNPKVRQEYIKDLWKFFLETSMQPFVENHEMMLDYLWTNELGSLVEFRRQIEEKGITTLPLEGDVINDLKPISGLVSLERLALTNAKASDLSPLNGLVNLKGLILADNKTSDLSPLRDLVNLEELVFRKNNIKNLSPLSDLVNLRVLYIEDNKVNDLSPLDGLTNLEDLLLRNCKVSDLSPLSGLVNLKRIEVTRSHVSDLSPLNSLVNLKDLILDSNKTSDLGPLRNLVNLENLFSINNNIENLSPLSDLVKLRVLYIEDNKVNDLSPLDGLTNLEDLSCVSDNVKDLSPLSSLAGLENLVLMGKKISDLNPLSGLANIENLTVCHTDIRDLSPLRNLMNLKYLDIAYSEVNDLSPLSELVNLENLDLSNCKISDLSPLSNLTNLKKLDLTDAKINDLTPLSSLVNLEIVN
jgi:internalin A